MFTLYAISVGGRTRLQIGSAHADRAIVTCWLEQLQRDLQQTYPGYAYDWTDDRELLTVTRPNGKRTAYFVDTI